MNGTLHHGDALTIMREMPSESVGMVVTSPPYNFRNSTGGGFKNPSGPKHHTPKLTDGYDGHSDNLPRDEYVALQRACLKEMLRILSPDGAIFWNHKYRVQNGLLQDHSDILDGFPVRQIIIWKGSTGINYNPGYFLPNYEVVYLICPKAFRLRDRANILGCIWDIWPDRNNPHPCPFPVELARICIKSTPDHLEPVLDPFMGSGTTAAAAQECGRSWIGIEQSLKYVEMAKNRLENGPLLKKVDHAV